MVSFLHFGVCAEHSLSLAVYSQQFAGRVWDNVRSCRIRMHQLIHERCSKLLPSSPRNEHRNLRLQSSASESLAILLAEQICATVPHLPSCSDCLSQFVEPTEFVLPACMKYRAVGMV